ncbi:MAG TPA: 16S rRNA (cytidine(1402)-2'-O)-methyltransferase [Gammaproteobacteria bacterium]|nr:16S rRNA (cytidine(1402)-2'-O)-methyltransferase [Gammaproteobacteria bacterium]
MNRNHFGILYVVATPIGNLQDMGPRAVEVLKTVEGILAEDTRHSAPLLQHFMIDTKMLALHEHNERQRTAIILERLRQGESIALISDAGTPLINDPGYFLVREAIKAGIRVAPVPGPCALIAALSISGLPTDRFCFEGFLPAKSKHRVQHLELLRNETRTLVFYEAPHRVMDSLQDMLTVFGGEREVVIARELTKLYETVYSGTLSHLLEWVREDENRRRGEIVLIVKGKEKTVQIEEGVSMEHILKILLAELPLSQAVELTAKISNQRKNEIYQRALQLNNKA